MTFVVFSGFVSSGASLSILSLFSFSTKMRTLCHWLNFSVSAPITVFAALLSRTGAGAQASPHWPSPSLSTLQRTAFRSVLAS